MKKKQTLKMIAFAALMTFAMMLSACSNDNSANDNDTASQNDNVMPPANSTNTGNDPSNAGNGGSNGNTSNQPTDNTGNDTSSPSNGESQTTQDIKAMLTLAKEGKVKGIPFAADTGLIDDVEKEWGKSDKTDFAGKGNYATYAKKHAVIGFNKGSVIFDVRSDAAELQTLTLQEIEAALGKADKITTNGSDNIYSYEANKTFELRFVIPSDTGKVHHISVYSPDDAKNNMAG